ncbi:hypothetical protein C8Q80DRAFT_346356 [Daedaleopsis nitida]|nr:hypothetical protein C8Q80DRAFT_346356 [Daedaleopsis nitida]
MVCMTSKLTVVIIDIFELAEQAQRSDPLQGSLPPHVNNPALIMNTPEVDKLRRWSDKMGNNRGLEPAQRSEIQQNITIALSHEHGDLKHRIWLQILLYNVLNKLDSVDRSTSRLEERVTQTEAQNREAWKLEPERKAIVRLHARDIIFDPSRTSFMDMNLDLLKLFESNRVKFGFEDIFDDEMRKTRFKAECKDKSSRARTALRSEIITSVFGRARTDLEHATWKIAEKFHIGGAGTTLSPDYQLLVALLRRWCYDIFAKGNEHVSQDEFNKIVAAQAFIEEHKSDSSDEEDETDAAVKSVKTAVDIQVVPTVGKVPKGKDFWSLIDKEYARQIKERGANWLTDAWREYFVETFSLERVRWGSSKGNLLPALPTIYQKPSAQPLAPGTPRNTTPDSQLAYRRGTTAMPASSSTFFGNFASSSPPAVFGGSAGTLTHAPFTFTYNYTDSSGMNLLDADD